RKGQALLPFARANVRSLELQREAQYRANGDNDGKHPEILQRRLDRHRADDVGDDQEFETEQDGASEVGTQLVIGIVKTATAKQPPCKGKGRQSRAATPKCR